MLSLVLQAGVRQGGVLSSIMFVIYIIEQLQQSGMDVISMATFSVLGLCR